MPREILLDPQRQIQILGRAAVPAADAPQEVATEDAERAGDVVDEIEGIEPGATQMYGERVRSEEHTSELQSPCNLVCRLLLEKKKKRPTRNVKHTNNSTIVSIL